MRQFSRPIAPFFYSVCLVFSVVKNLFQSVLAEFLFLSCPIRTANPSVPSVSLGSLLPPPNVDSFAPALFAQEGMRVKLSKVGPFFGKVWAFSLVVAAVAQESFVKAVGLFDAGG